jgi:sodium-dependent dicarboxylate transporter 2/3/5
MKNKQIFGIILAVLIFVVLQFVPEPEGLSRVGLNTIALTLAFIVILITEVFNMSVTCLIFLSLMYVTGATPSFTSALTGFSSQVVFFVLASFGIAAAFTRIPLSKRILRALMKAFGKNVKTLVFAIMLCSAFISAIVSDLIPKNFVNRNVSHNMIKYRK